MINNAWVGIFTPGAPHGSGPGRIWTAGIRSATTIIEYTGTLNDGTYEMRLFRRSAADSESHIMTIPFVVDSSTVTVLINENYAPGEPIIITPSGITLGLINNAWIGIFTPGAPHGSGPGRIWTSTIRSATTTIEYTGTLNDGAYEMRLFRRSAADSESHVITIPFVTDSSSVNVSINERYAPGEPIIITPSGVTFGLINNAWIGIFTPEAPHGSGSGRVWTNTIRSATAPIEFTGTLDDGNYELRLFRRSAADNESHIMTIPFVVGMAPAATPSPQPTEPPSSIGIIIDGQSIEMDVPPFIRDGRTFVPLRAIGEAIGVVEWLGEAQTASITLPNGTIIAMTIGQYVILVTGNEGSSSVVENDAAPVIVDGRTMLPVRGLAEAAGFNVVWDGANQNVIITTQ